MDTSFSEFERKPENYRCRSELSAAWNYTVASQIE
jgi:hypothetical protein